MIKPYREPTTLRKCEWCSETKRTTVDLIEQPVYICEEDLRGEVYKLGVKYLKNKTAKKISRGVVTAILIIIWLLGFFVGRFFQGI